MRPLGPPAAQGEVDLERLLDDARALVNVESPSSDAAAVRASARVVAEVGARLLGAMPEILGAGPATHVRWRFGTGQARVLLLGHHDTVWPKGSVEARPFDVSEGRMTGPGCFDMKVGIAMMLHAAAALGCRDDLTLLVTGDEEIGSPNSRELIEAEASGCSAVLVLEPSADGGALKTERKGIAFYEVMIEGLAAHAGLEPERGVNAAVELAHQIIALEQLGDSATGTTVVPTLATAGTAINTVPAAARVHVDVRAWSDGELHRVDRQLRMLQPRTAGASVRVSGGVNRPPLTAALSASLFARARRIANELGLPVLQSAAVGGGSDGNFTAGVGIPTLDGLGAAGGGAHGESEHVHVAELAGRTTLVRALIRDLLDEELT